MLPDPAAPMGDTPWFRGVFDGTDLAVVRSKRAKGAAENAKKASA
jgi:hypothetical protein